MLQVEFYFNQIEVRKNHVHALNKYVLNACCVPSPLRGPGGESCQLRRSLAQSLPRGTYGHVNEFVNSQM